MQAVFSFVSFANLSVFAVDESSMRMSDDQARWHAAAGAINERMHQLGLSQVDLIRRSGVSAFTVRRLQKGVPANYREANVAKVCLALGWTADSLRRLLNGDDPLPAADPHLQPVPDQATVERLEARVLTRLAEMEARLEARIAAVEEKVTGYNAGGSSDGSNRS